MYSKPVKLALAGLQLAGLGGSLTEPGMLKPIYASGTHGQSDLTQRFSLADLRAIEGAHLEIYAACKWGKASFAPREDEDSAALESVAGLYRSMERA